MSRTNKGAKGPGWEYWSRRASALGVGMWSPSSWVKRFAARKERRKVHEALKSKAWKAGAE